MVIPKYFNLWTKIHIGNLGATCSQPRAKEKDERHYPDMVHIFPLA